jgi:hypothetical protein
LQKAQRLFAILQTARRSAAATGQTPSYRPLRRKRGRRGAGHQASRTECFAALQNSPAPAPAELPLASSNIP